MAVVADSVPPPPLAIAKVTGALRTAKPALSRSSTTNGVLAVRKVCTISESPPTMVIAVGVPARPAAVNTTGAVGWYAAGAFLSLFLAVNRALLAIKAWRARAASRKVSNDV